MSTEAPRVGPVSLTERIQFIDVLRGMALFGILTANMRAFSAPLDAYDSISALFHSHADILAQAFVNFFFQGKFVSIFSFMFGMGFAIQLSRAEARGAKFLSFYPRRLLALAVFGLIHGILIWSGDILLTYALSGAILLLFRNRKQKTLLWWAGGLISFSLVLQAVFILIYYFAPHRPHFLDFTPPDMPKLYGIINIYAHGTVRQILHQNWVEWKGALPGELFALYALSLFLLGMWVWRSGIVQNLPSYRPVFKKVCAWCLPIGFLMNGFYAYENAVVPPDKITFAAILASMFHLLGAHILAAGYICGVALIYLNANLRRFVTPFAAVGRMALTDYLMQSVLCTLFFYHYTTGLFGRWGPAIDLIPTVLLFSAQVVFSNWWLCHFRFGPMEWLWRGLTYGKFPSMRKGEPEFGIDALPGDAASPVAASAPE